MSCASGCRTGSGGADVCRRERKAGPLRGRGVEEVVEAEAERARCIPIGYSGKADEECDEDDDEDDDADEPKADDEEADDVVERTGIGVTIVDVEVAMSNAAAAFVDV